MKTSTPVITAIALCTFYNQIFCMEIMNIRGKTYDRPVHSLFNLCIQQCIKMVNEKNPLLNDNPKNATLNDIDFKLKKEISHYMFDIKEHNQNEKILHSDENTLITVQNNNIISFDKNKHTVNYSYYMPHEERSAVDMYFHNQCANVVFWADNNKNLNLINEKGELEIPLSIKGSASAVVTNFISSPNAALCFNNLCVIFNLDTKLFLDYVGYNYIVHDDKHTICACQTDDETTIYSLINNTGPYFLTGTSNCKISGDGKWIITTDINETKISFFSRDKEKVMININGSPHLPTLEFLTFDKSYSYCTLPCKLTAYQHFYPIINTKKGTITFTIKTNRTSRLGFGGNYLAISYKKKIHLVHKKHLQILEGTINIPDHMYIIQDLLELFPILEFCNNQKTRSNNPINPSCLFHSDGKHIISIDDDNILKIIHIKSGITVFSQKNVLRAQFFNKKSLEITSLEGEETYIIDLFPKISL